MIWITRNSLFHEMCFLTRPSFLKLLIHTNSRLDRTIFLQNLILGKHMWDPQKHPWTWVHQQGGAPNRLVQSSRSLSLDQESPFAAHLPLSHLSVIQIAAFPRVGWLHSAQSLRPVLLPVVQLNPSAQAAHVHPPAKPQMIWMLVLVQPKITAPTKDFCPRITLLRPFLNAVQGKKHLWLCFKIMIVIPFALPKKYPILLQLCLLLQLSQVSPCTLYLNL